VKVVLRNPRRELDVAAPSTVELVTRDARLADADVVEIRPVVSGGARP
jgi:hypothetical protein